MIEPGTYQHYKGAHYLVRCVATWAGNDGREGEAMVVYSPLAPQEELIVYVRSLEEFAGLVQVDRDLIPRFRRVN